MLIRIRHPPNVSRKTIFAANRGWNDCRSNRVIRNGL